VVPCLGRETAERQYPHGCTPLDRVQEIEQLLCGTLHAGQGSQAIRCKPEGVFAAFIAAVHPAPVGGKRIGEFPPSLRLLRRNG
jgi:hypothetical protein